MSNSSALQVVGQISLMFCIQLVDSVSWREDFFHMPGALGWPFSFTWPLSPCGISSPRASLCGPSFQQNSQDCLAVWLLGSKKAKCKLPGTTSLLFDSTGQRKSQETDSRRRKTDGRSMHRWKKLLVAIFIETTPPSGPASPLHPSYSLP